MSRAMVVMFRCDAGPEVGNGHLIRCLALAGQLQSRGHRTVFLMRPVDQTLQAQITSAGHGLIQLAEADADHNAIAKIRECYASQPIDWLIVDSYWIDVQWESRARPFVRKILIIDDLGNRRHDCDVLVDQNVHNRLQNAYPKLVPPACKQLIGTNFLLAREAFYQSDVSANAEGLLIFFGGGDHHLLLDTVLDHLASLENSPTLKVLTTSAYRHRDELKKKTERIPGSSFFIDVADPCQLYRSSRAALVRCGFVAYELALLGVPMIVVHDTPVQHEVADALEASGNAVGLEERDLDMATALQAHLTKLDQLSPRPWNTFLRSGANRLADILEESLT